MTASGFLLLGVSFLFTGYYETWELYNIPALRPFFADLRVITAGAESRALGYDPLLNNPADPWGRTLNYPRAWQSLYLAGINQSHTVYIGIALWMLFVISLFLFTSDNITRGTALLILLIVFSPAVLFGIERGNIDLLMFFILSVALVSMNKDARIYILFAYGLILSAFLLKLYPVFGFVSSLREKKGLALLINFTFLTAACIYAGYFYSDLRLISLATPRPTKLAYGADVLWMGINDRNAVVGQVVRLLSYAGLLLSTVVMLGGFFDGKSRPDEKADVDRKSMDAFRMGSGIYAGTFLLGSNCDYRLVFLLFVIPQLVFWTKHFSGYVSRISKILIFSILISAWHLEWLQVFSLLPVGRELAFLVEESANWITFGGLVYLVSYSMPFWIKHMVTTALGPLIHWRRTKSPSHAL